MTEAYVTLATNDRYALGALVLGHSLRQVKTSRQLCILITPGVTDVVRSQLNITFDAVVNVDVMDSNDSAHLALLKRPELGVTFTKLHCWTLTQYSKCVFLDADVLAVQNADELFEYPELSAVCDIGWPDCFNSGMFVFTPSLETYSKLLQQSEQTGSFDGGDQGLLNTFFTSWTRLSFVYNMVASVTYTYLPAYKQYGSGVKFVHFLGSSKPWEQSFHTQSGTVISKPGQEQISSHLNAWWSIFSTGVKPGLPETVSTASPTEVCSPAHECKHSQEVQETEPHISYTQTTHTEYSAYLDHPQQVMTSAKKLEATNDIHEWVDSSHAHVDICTNQEDTASFVHSIEVVNTDYVGTLESDVHILTNSNQTQEWTEPQKPQFSDEETQSCHPSLLESTCELLHREPEITIHENTQPSSSSPSASNDPRLEGERHEDKITAHVSDRQLANTSNSVHHDAFQLTLTSHQLPKPDPEPSQASTSSNTICPQFNQISTSPHHQLSGVPEIKYDATQIEESSERKQPVLWAGRSPRVPLPPSLDDPFQPLVNPRIPSPFSHPAASFQSAKSTVLKLADQLRGLNVSESLDEGRRRWEEGIPDFRGIDSFENILAHIDAKLNTNN